MITVIWIKLRQLKCDDAVIKSFELLKIVSTRIVDTLHFQDVIYWMCLKESLIQMQFWNIVTKS